MEGGVTDAFKVFIGQGIAGAIAVLAMIAAVLLYKELRATYDRWMIDRQTTSDKRIEELRVQTAVIERNTAAHLEATKTNEARAVTLQRLVDDHADHKRAWETMQQTLNEMRASIGNRRGDQ